MPASVALMSPAELRTILDGLHLPQVRAAKLLGVDDRTMRRWIKGDAPMPELAVRVLRAAAEGRISLADIQPL